jgi:cysteine sulfinate desulfinase/cysteine desulfurase-like protein
VASLRCGVGGFTTAEEVDFAIDHVAQGVARLRAVSGVGAPVDYNRGS